MCYRGAKKNPLTSEVPSLLLPNPHSLPSDTVEFHRGLTIAGLVLQI